MSKDSAVNTAWKCFILSIVLLCVTVFRFSKIPNIAHQVLIRTTVYKITIYINIVCQQLWGILGETKTWLNESPELWMNDSFTVWLPIQFCIGSRNSLTRTCFLFLYISSVVTSEKMTRTKLLSWLVVRDRNGWNRLKAQTLSDPSFGVIWHYWVAFGFKYQRRLKKRRWREK